MTSPSPALPLLLRRLLCRLPRPGPGPARAVASRTVMSSSALPPLPLLRAIASHDPDAPAVLHCTSGRSFAYGRLLPDVACARDRLRHAAGRADLDGRTVAFLVENSYDYVVTLLAVLAAGAIAVPLSPAFPTSELQYILDHSQASVLVSSQRFAAKADDLLAAGLVSQPAHLRLAKHVDGPAGRPVAFEDADPAASAASLMLYTSGTTNRPKGVVLPHATLAAQAQSLIEAWRYSPSDRLLHVLPLHHIHGAVNAVLTPLVAGASVEFLFPFNADAVWRRLAAPFVADSAATSPAPVTFFTAVPTVYSRLLSSHGTLPAAHLRIGGAADAG
ncbi:hypothetical protein CDD83_5353 [Cordyceps sp. RAO-2017]|nr:hypothetical protein CDD83_5353 [Cordyceps sp. RAO-2017]